MPGFAGLFSEIVSKKPRRRGRPRKYTSPKHRAFEKKVLGGAKRHPRSVQNYHNAQRAYEILKQLDAAELLIPYFENRRTILAAIGRIEERKYLISAACSIAYHRLRGAAAYAEIRKARYGDRWPDIIRLLNKIRKAVREYRNLYPHQSSEHLRDAVENVFERFLEYDLKHDQEKK